MKKLMFSLFILLIVCGIVLAYPTGSKNNNITLPENRGNGGNDNYGHMWIDSNETNGPIFSWNDISATGNVISENDWIRMEGNGGWVASDEGYSPKLPIGFDFSFYGTIYDSLYIGTNGLIHFDLPSDYSDENDPLPHTSLPSNIIAPFWDDLCRDGYNWQDNFGLVYYQYESDRMIIQYHHWKFYDNPDSDLNFQVHLIQNGDIEFYYESMSTNGNLDEATVGIENSGGTDALEIVYNSVYIEDNLAVLITMATSDYLVPDVNFRTVLNAMLNPPQPPEYNTTIAELNNLLDPVEAEDLNIVSIEGAQYLTNICELNLSSNLITDISQLSGLNNLTHLYLESNQITDITDLSGMCNLEFLTLKDNLISDISILSNLSCLETLFCDNNEISDISPLSGLTNLEFLHLDYNQISDISAVSGLVNLIVLDLGWNDIIDISAVSSLINLDKLYLGGNNIIDISPIASITYLEDIFLDYNQISDISPLANLTNLDDIWLQGNNITDIYPLVQNTYIGYGDDLKLASTSSTNPLSLEAFQTHIPILLARNFNLFTYPDGPNYYLACYPTPVRNMASFNSLYLSWQAEFNADVTYEIYLGQSASNLDYLGMGTYSGSSLYSINVSLNSNTTYWWRIKTVIDGVSYWSGLWNFTTVENVTPHFTPCFCGNGYQNMTFVISSATIAGFDLQAGDQIGIFDGNLCVGAGILMESITSAIQITASEDDPNTTEIDGFTCGNEISFKLWDYNESLEYENVGPNYIVGNGLFNSYGTSQVALEGFENGYGYISCELIPGWNMISFNVIPENLNLQSIMQPLIDIDNLVKAQDETGLALVNLPETGWINGIGNMESTEGYYVYVNESDLLYSSGELLPSSNDIELLSGWNYISFPCQNEIDAQFVVQSLIDNNILVKVQNDAGEALWNHLGCYGWINNIGNFVPGEGYFINVNSDITLTISDSGDALMTNNINNHYPPSDRELNHFIPAWQNNPYLAMNLFITSLEIVGISLEPNDELAIFDGDICVGSVQIGDGDIISIIASTDNPLTDEIDGFSQYNEMQFKFWDYSENAEYTDMQIEFTSGDDIFTSLGTSIIEIEVQPLGNDNIISVQNILGQNYPNPFNPTTTIDFGLKEAGIVKINVYNLKGQQVCTLINDYCEAGNHQVMWNGRNNDQKKVTSGVYLYKMQAGGRYTTSRKMILLK